MILQACQEGSEGQEGREGREQAGSRPPITAATRAAPRPDPSSDRIMSNL